MKYGLYYIGSTSNIGDDIWAYAQSLFYPHIDYLIDNEQIYKFRTKDNEIVTSIMGAFMEKKDYEFNFWCPDNIIPFFIGSYFRPTMWDYLSNDSVKNYIKQFEPIGVRSHSNVHKFNKLGIKSYFSGCISLTLPQRKKRTGKYICCVDVDEKISEYIKEAVGDCLDVRIMTHDVRKWNDDEKENYYKSGIYDKFDLVKKYLDIYANAHCVITSRLHCALPCLTQQTPVLVAFPKDGHGVSDVQDRMSSYFDMFHTCYYEDFEERIVDYDFLKPPKNPNTFVQYRDAIIQKINDYITQCENGDIIKSFRRNVNISELTRMTDYVNILTNEITKLKRENKYIFPFQLVHHKSKVVLYGAGVIGKNYNMQLEITKYADVVAWVDKNYKYYQELYMDVVAPDAVCKIEFDYIVIAIQNSETAASVAEVLNKVRGVDREKIIYFG